jgi:hypothetical protein
MILTIDIYMKIYIYIQILSNSLNGRLIINKMTYDILGVIGHNQCQLRPQNDFFHTGTVPPVAMYVCRLNIRYMVYGMVYLV